MKIEIIKKNYEPASKLEEVIMKKIGKLDKYFHKDADIKVLLKKERETFKMEITVSLKGMFIRSETSGDNMYDNIDVLLPKIEKQIIKHKGKLIQNKKLKQEAFNDSESLFSSEPLENGAAAAQVIKTKSFEIYPKSTEDAIAEMEMLGHDFFVYVSSGSRKIEIVYKRGNGGYGVLQPIVND